MKLLELASKNRLISLWFVFLSITFLASILYLNPTLDPNKSVLSYPQLELQFAYTPDNGVKVLERWGENSAAVYLSVIWIDVLFALSYGPFFFMLLRRLSGLLFAALIPLIEMLTNLVETSMEIYWVANHGADNPMLGLFLTHSIIATIKWILVPIYLVHTIVVIWKAVKRRRPAPAH